MKKTIVMLVVLFVAVGAYAQTSASDTLPVIKFEKLEHDFGKIKEGTLATYEFVVENTGKTPLIFGFR